MSSGKDEQCPVSLKNLFKQKIILILTIELQPGYLTSSFLKKKNNEISFYSGNGHFMSMLCQVIKMNYVHFPWSIDIKYNNIWQ